MSKSFRARIAGINRLFVFFFSLLCMAFLFNNCAPAFKLKNLNSSSSSDNQLGFSSSFVAGNFDDNCFTAGIADACVFWKNPLASANLKSSLNSFSSYLKKGDNVDKYQNFSIKLQNLTNNSKLESSYLKVVASNGNETSPSQLTLSNGKYIKRYSESSSPDIAQLMAYFWINYMENQFKTQTGLFFPMTTKLTVDAYNTTNSNANNNAFYSYASHNVTIGYASQARSPSNIDHEMGLSAEVYIHEMGHANHHYAFMNTLDSFNSLHDSPNDILYDSNSNLVCKTGTGTYALQDFLSSSCTSSNSMGYFCKTNSGCISAMSEGIADFHHLLIFSDRPALGETFKNSIYGLQTRNVSLLTDYNNIDFFTDVSAVYMSEDASKTYYNGEIHGFGSLYSSILWDIYNTPGVDKTSFAKTFVQHLQYLLPNSNYKDGQDALIAADKLVGGNNSTFIKNGFSIRGIK